MDLEQARRLFGYADLPPLEQVRKDFDARMNGLSTAQRQVTDDNKKKEYTRKIQELIAARDLIQQRLRQKPVPGPPSPQPQPTPRPAPPRPQPTPQPIPPQPQPQPFTPVWPLNPPPPKPKPFLSRPWATVLFFVLSLMIVPAAAFIINGLKHIFATKAAVQSVLSTPIPLIPASAQANNSALPFESPIIQTPAPTPSPSPAIVQNEQLPCAQPAGFLLVRPYPWARVVLLSDGNAISQWNAPHAQPVPVASGEYGLLIKWLGSGVQANCQVRIEPGRTTTLVVSRQNRKSSIQIQ